MNIKIWTLSSGKGLSGLEHFLVRIAKNWWSRWQGWKCSRGCHSYTSKIHFRTESWFRAHSWPRAGEVRAPRDRLTTQAGWERDENLGYFKARVIKKGQCHSKTNPSTSVAHLYARHVSKAKWDRDERTSRLHHGTRTHLALQILGHLKTAFLT